VLVEELQRSVIFFSRGKLCVHLMWYAVTFLLPDLTHPPRSSLCFASHS
jgi:hypothetical protein